MAPNTRHNTTQRVSLRLLRLVLSPTLLDVRTACAVHDESNVSVAKLNFAAPRGTSLCANRAWACCVRRHTVRAESRR